MRKIVLLAVISLVAAPVAAEQQATPQQDNQTKAAVPAKKPADGKQENSYEWRIRTEGSAGAPPPHPSRSAKAWARAPRSTCASTSSTAGCIGAPTPK